MHQALSIQEILFNIFGHCAPTESYWTEDRRRSTAALAALARTCRTFSEPALDVLWSEVIDLTPLARCIPEASHAVRTFSDRFCYSLTRRLNDTEWGVLRSYTRRVWYIYGYSSSDGWLDDASLTAICSPVATDPLFPNIRFLWWQGKTLIPAVHIAVPSLTSLSLRPTPATPGPELSEFLDTVAHCPNIQKFQFHLPPSRTSNETICRHICRLTDLREIYCRGVNLDIDAFSHLSRMPSLTRLSYLPYGLSAHVPDGTLSSGSTTVFPALTWIKVRLFSLEQITEFLSHTRLPAIELLKVDFSARPSKETFRTFLTTTQSIYSANSLTSLGITCEYTPGVFIPIETGPQLTLDDVHPLKTYVNFRHVHINVQWSVGLTDRDLVALVSAWPHLHTLIINDQWGWRTTGGITLRGLLRLLQMRRTLSHLCIAIRTESYTDLSHGCETLFWSRLEPLTINFADSAIQTADMPALANVIVKLGFRTTAFLAWEGRHMNFQGSKGYKGKWIQVFDAVRNSSSGSDEKMGFDGDAALGSPNTSSGGTPPPAR